LCIFLISCPGAEKSKEPGTGQLCPVAIQVLCSLMFEFSERGVYFHFLLGYSLKYVVTCIYPRKEQFERTKDAEICNDP